VATGSHKQQLCIRNCRCTLVESISMALDSPVQPWPPDSVTAAEYSLAMSVILCQITPPQYPMILMISVFHVV
jgi:hypothetical protein